MKKKKKTTFARIYIYWMAYIGDDSDDDCGYLGEQVDVQMADSSHSNNNVKGYSDFSWTSKVNDNDNEEEEEEEEESDNDDERLAAYGVGSDATLSSIASSVHGYSGGYSVYDPTPTQVEEMRERMKVANDDDNDDASKSQVSSTSASGYEDDVDVVVPLTSGKSDILASFMSDFGAKSESDTNEEDDDVGKALAGSEHVNRDIDIDVDVDSDVVGDGEEVRDWNVEFQRALACRDAEQRYVLLSRLSADFLYSANTYGRIIISEYHLDEAKKTIKPDKSFGGCAGGVKVCLSHSFSLSLSLSCRSFAA
jgi:Clustered mitochondria